jgi:hypothetical protein
MYVCMYEASLWGECFKGGLGRNFERRQGALYLGANFSVGLKIRFKNWTLEPTYYGGFESLPGANPTTAIYNASAVKIYNAISNLHIAFKNKYFLPLWKTL